MRISLTTSERDFVLVCLRNGLEEFKQKASKYLYDPTLPRYREQSYLPVVAEYERIAKKLIGEA